MADAAAIGQSIGDADVIMVKIESMVLGACNQVHRQFYLLGAQSGLDDVAEVITIEFLHGVHKQPVQQFLLLLPQAALLL